MATYSNTAYGFSFQYPESWKADDLQGPNEVARFYEDNQFRLPVIVATVKDRAAYGSMEDVADRFLDNLKYGIPGTSGFEITEQRPVTLKDGTEAYSFTLHWIWTDGSTAMDSTAVVAFSGDNAIIISATVLSDMNVSREMKELCMTLDTTL
jgi:hypothetical protein